VNWRIVVHKESKKLLVVGGVVIGGRRLDVRFDYTVLKPGRYELDLFLLSDSYVGADPEEDFEVEAAEGMHENEVKTTIMNRLSCLLAIELIGGERGQLGDCN